MAYIMTSLTKNTMLVGGNIIREQPIFIGEQEDRCFFCNRSLENIECLDIGQGFVHLEVCHGEEA